MGRVRTALQVGVTLCTVAAVYALPWVLAAAGASSTELTFDAPVEGERVVVYWTPPEERAPEDADCDQAEGEDPGALAETAEPSDPVDASEAPSASPTDQVATEIAMVAPVVDPKARLIRHGETTRKRPHRATRTTRPPRELTKKQQRQRDRRQRRRERLAQQPQCHELVAQIVPVSEDEFYVGRDLAGCYRAHPLQFAYMGGMSWVEDEDDKHVGLRIRLSRGPKGQVGRAAGFKPGDVLKSLNGVPLRSKAGAGIAMMGLLGNKAKVKFTRGGEEHTVVLRVVNARKLAAARDEAEARARLAQVEDAAGPKRRTRNR